MILHLIILITEYANLIGSIMCLMNYTRPNIVHVVRSLSIYTRNTDRCNYDALHHLLRYLKGKNIIVCTLTNFLPYQKDIMMQTRLQTMIRLTLLVDMYFCSGVEQYLGSLQNRLAQLDPLWKSEFIALELAEQDAEWIKSLLEDVPLQGTSVPMFIHCD